MGRHGDEIFMVTVSLARIGKWVIALRCPDSALRHVTRHRRPRAILHVLAANDNPPTYSRRLLGRVDAATAKV
jgi:hypothetical protein